MTIVPLFFSNDRCMKKNKAKKRVTLIILEGVWGSGKTTLARALKIKYHAHIIKEPHHVRAGVRLGSPDSLTDWYIHTHEENLKKGAALALRDNVVVIERSALSSIVFAKVFLKKNSRKALSDFEKSVKRLRVEGVDVCVAYLHPANAKSMLVRMKRSIYLKKFAEIECVKKLDMCLLEELRTLKKKKILRLMFRPKPGDFSKLAR